MRKLCKTGWMFSFLMIPFVLFAVSCFKDIGEISQDDKILDQKLEALVALMLKEGLDEKAQQQLSRQINQLDSEQGERFFYLLRHRSADEENDNEDELKVQLPMIDEMITLSGSQNFMTKFRNYFPHVVDCIFTDDVIRKSCSCCGCK